ncbi:hypothetical protein GCM10007964_00880 [Sphaerisporangium melleum]|uniref:Uncharacterized protein n=1 Tax=Sphaerisporangium melleum TaxID=321316 RepID=A0A917VC52_9ACTN|nr:hypothetical protein GCM10007964_00880 [Sphaerisporangium melleum]
MTARCPTCNGHGEVPAEKTCALDGCGRTFTWQDGGRGRARPRRDAAYCSRSCAHTAAQRAYRARKAA